MKITKYELRDELDDLIRVFDSYDEAVRYMTSGDKLVRKVSEVPKLSNYDLAVKKVGYSDV